MFGQSLALDGEQLVVGAPFDSTSESFSGRVYVFPRAGDSFGEPTSFKASDPIASGLFGMSLGLDGNTLVVGAPQFNILRPWVGAGSAFVFEHSNGAWNELQSLDSAASLEDGATFGWSVAIAGNTLAVAAPRARSTDEGQGPGEAYIYERAAQGGMWKMTQPIKATVPRASDWFAWSLRLTDTTLLIGSPGDASSSTGLMGDANLDSVRDSGALYMYGRNKDQWVVTGFIKSSNSGTPDGFGGVLAIQGDTIISSSTGESSNATGVQGGQTNNALMRAGAAYVFR